MKTPILTKWMAEELEGRYSIQHHSNISLFSWLRVQEQPEHKEKHSCPILYCPAHPPAAPSCQELFPCKCKRDEQKSPSCWLVLNHNTPYIFRLVFHFYLNPFPCRDQQVRLSQKHHPPSCFQPTTFLSLLSFCETLWPFMTTFMP